MTELLAVALITVLAVIAPGADFAMIVRNSYLYGRRTGLLAATGVAAGVLVHVTYTMLGVGLLIASSTFLFTVIKLIGAAYLIYIGVRTFRTKGEVEVDLTGRTGLTPLAALRAGFLTNVLNPKTTLFVVSTFSQVVSPGTPVREQAGLWPVHVAGASAVVRRGRRLLLPRPDAHADAARPEGPQQGHRLGPGGPGRQPGAGALALTREPGAARTYLPAATATARIARTWATMSSRFRTNSGSVTSRVLPAANWRTGVCTCPPGRLSCSPSRSRSRVAR